ncbi:MAG: dephospho-CoA kinase [Proteobacteria bacterium]|nr:dephospho-CoA kinase [Pseudomonadota bacterium]
MPKHLIVGLTGGIGSGKSSAARRFRELGVRVIDTDEIGHVLSHPPSPALQQIASRMGQAFLLSDGSLDRTRMRKHVFSSPAARETLEAIFHPLIRQEVERQIGAETSAPYTILVVPLLFETQRFRALIQRSIVVDCSEEQQITRVMTRSSLSRTEVIDVMSTQLSRENRLNLADDIICNNGTLEQLEDQVEQLHQRLLLLANSVQ